MRELLMACSHMAIKFNVLCLTLTGLQKPRDGMRGEILNRVKQTDAPASKRNPRAPSCRYYFRMRGVRNFPSAVPSRAGVKSARTRVGHECRFSLQACGVDFITDFILVLAK
jgi:hypothetical protein